MDDMDPSTGKLGSTHGLYVSTEHQHQRGHVQMLATGIVNGGFRCLLYYSRARERLTTQSYAGSNRHIRTGFSNRQVKRNPESRHHIDIVRVCAARI
jgi:hypothetical protein